MDHLLLLDQSGKIVVSRLEPACRENCFDVTPVGVEKCKSCVDGKLRRRGKLIGSNGTVFLCSDDEDLVNSKRIFQKSLTFYEVALTRFRELGEETVKRVQTENRRLVHNLTTLNTHILQEIYAIASQEELTGGPQLQIQAIRRQIKSRENETAAAVLRVLKNVVAARTEMQIVRRLQSDSNTALVKKHHQIHRVINNVLITFFQDSHERNIGWSLGQSRDSVLFDYETVSAAMYRLFENAVKYCKSGTDVAIEFKPKRTQMTLTMSMISLRVDDDEKERIFEENYSGKHAKTSNLNGDGLGLFFVREMLALNGATIRLETGEVSPDLKDSSMTLNSFIIDFPPDSLVKTQAPNFSKTRPNS